MNITKKDKLKEEKIDELIPIFRKKYPNLFGMGKVTQKDKLKELKKKYKKEEVFYFSRSADQWKWIEKALAEEYKRGALNQALLDADAIKLARKEGFKEAYAQRIKDEDKEWREAVDGEVIKGWKVYKPLKRR